MGGGGGEMVGGGGVRWVGWWEGEVGCDDWRLGKVVK